MALLYGLPLLFGSVGSWFVGTMLEEELKPKSDRYEDAVQEQPLPQRSMFDFQQPSGLGYGQQPSGLGYGQQTSLFDGMGFRTSQSYNYPQPSFAERLGLVPSRYTRPSYGYYSPPESSSFFGSESGRVQQSAAPVQNVYAPQQGFFNSMFPQTPTPPTAATTPISTQTEVSPTEPISTQTEVSPTEPISTQTEVSPTEPISTQTEPSIIEQIQSAVSSMLPASTPTPASSSTRGSSTTQGEITAFGPRDMSACGEEPETQTEQSTSFGPRDMSACGNQELVERPVVEQPISEERADKPAQPISTGVSSISVPTNRRIRDLPNY